jgi:phosphoglycolate phosphatase
MSKYNYILFDLDGTLTESGEGIINSIQYALKKWGRPEPDREKLKAFVGPPLVDSFQKYYGMTAEESLHCTELFREYFVEKGWKENRVYDGIPEVLETLRSRGKHLLVATSKPEVQARRILDYFDLSRYFDFIGGATLDETRNHKWTVIQYVIETVGPEHRNEMIMVGDRSNDVEGAARNQLPCIGVIYGYGSRSELEEAGAKMICPNPSDLLQLL